jgi:signal transduction histidine kinase
VEGRPQGRWRRPPAGTIGVLGRAAALVGLLLLLIWVITAPKHFWVMWAWFGLAIPFALLAALRIGLRDPAGVGRPVSVLWALSGLVIVLLLVIWALSGAGAFWPVYPVAALLLLDLVLGWVVLEKRRIPRGRRALTDRIDVLTRSRRQTVDAQAAELRRIERDLHDGAQARLVALSMSLGRAELRLSGEPEARELVLDAQRQTREAIAELRDLTRGISPPLLAERGVAAAVAALAARYHAEVEASEELADGLRLDPAIESAAYFVAAEGLSNAAKHAGARHIGVRLELRDGALLVRVADDGRGGARPSGSGIQGLETRVRALDGEMSLESPAGRGTRLEVSLPCEW